MRHTGGRELLRCWRRQSRFYRPKHSKSDFKKNDNDQRHEDMNADRCDSTGGADRALRDTAQKFIDRAEMPVDLKKVEQNIHDQPFRAAVIAAAAGFVFGGGLVTRPGLALLALFLRRAAQETMTTMVSGKFAARFARLNAPAMRAKCI